MPRRFEVLDEDDEPIRARGPSPQEWLRFGLDAGRRHWLVGLLAFALVTSLAFWYAGRRTPLYRAQAKILVQRAQALPSAVRSLFEDSPARSAWEMVHRRENLVAIIQQAHLLEAAARAPKASPLRQLLDQALAAVKGKQQAPRDPTDTLVMILDRDLQVSGEEGTITIQLDWPEPTEAYAVVQAALQNFLEARHVQEVTALDAVITVLEKRTGELRRELDSINAATPRRRRAGPAVARALPMVPQPSEELSKIRAQLDSRTRAIQDLESYRRRQLADLQAQYEQARNTLSEQHPTLVALRQQIDAMGGESPQLEQLRREESELRKAYAERAAREGVTGAAAVAQAPVAPLFDEPTPDEDERVADARRRYEEMNARLSTAQVEREAAQAAFKYRYNVIWPPRIPIDPIGPKRAKILVAGLFAAFCSAFGAATLLELVRGRVSQRWQVEQALQLQVFGEIERR